MKGKPDRWKVGFISLVVFLAISHAFTIYNQYRDRIERERRAEFYRGQAKAQETMYNMKALARGKMELLPLVFNDVRNLINTF